MIKFLAKFFAKFFVPIVIIMAIIIIVVGVRFMIIRVQIDQIGVKTTIWGIRRGVVQKDFKPGWHKFIRQIESWDLYDGTVQTLNLTREARNAKGQMESREIRIRTADDYDVTVDIIVKYQIMKGRANKIRQEIGPGDRYKIFVENEAKDVARSVLGKMTEKNLYNPDEKRRRAEEAKILLSSQLESRHVKVIDWLILDMRFDAQLERKIKNVKLAELDELLNIAKERAVEKRGITQSIDATTEALAQKIQSDKDGQIVTLKAQMDVKVTEIVSSANKFMIEQKAEGDHYMHVRHAAGELLVDRAKAEGERLRRVAMTGLGGDLIVALEAARNINLDNVVVSTQDMDLLNVDEMIIKLGAGVERDLPIILELEDSPGSLKLSDDLPEVLRDRGGHGGGHDGGHGKEEHEKPLKHRDSAPYHQTDKEQDHGASLLEEHGHESDTHHSHEASGETRHDTTHEDLEPSSMTQSFPVSQ
ncbi:membrane protease subunits [Candidatus Scalindua japonica]|uniref:Membrane protease subunits n=1 Tax=Candidatus Scalindua japonica TaxID=1284222 RepID=A0A286U0U9_9BACT|nr:SPFH domain-containing protein [Candidatus Scalindua japonica]GAX61701.1 membrane protease subunits [Candidatus Scalindua japonica]